MKIFRIILALGCLGLAALTVLLLYFSDKSLSASNYWSPLSSSRLQGFLESNISETNENVEILEILLGRKPRLDKSKLKLATYLLGEGDYEGFLEVYYRLFNTARAGSNELSKVLAIVSAGLELRRLIAVQIETQKPYWGGLYLKHLVKQLDLPPEEYLSLFQYYPAEHQFLYNHLLETQTANVAYQAFIELNPNVQEKKVLILDPNFLDETINWPFGWNLNKKIASRNVGGGVYLAYFGKGNPILLNQLIKVGSGKFEIQLFLKGMADRSHGYYKLETRCWKGDIISSLVIDKVNSIPKKYSLEFETVSKDCEFITVALLGQSGEYPRAAHLEVDSINLYKLRIEDQQ